MDNKHSDPAIRPKGLNNRILVVYNSFLSPRPQAKGFEEESSDLDSGSKRPKRRPIIEELD
jgi:hypothetical protein